MTCRTESHRAADARARPARSTTTTGLPEDLLVEQMRRLRLCAAVAMGLWAFGLVMDAFVRPGTVGSPFLVSTLVIEGAAIAGSALLFAYLRFTAHPPRLQAHAGLVFMVLNAMGVGLLNTWARPLTDDALNELSWNTIVILCGAMLMPATPKQMLVAALLAASMDPLGVWVAAPARPRGALGDAHVRPVPAELRLRARGGRAGRRILQRLGRRLRQAQELGSYHLERAPRPRRHGRSVAGAAPAAGAQRRDQAGAARGARRRRPTPRPRSCCGASSARRRRRRP